jgi:uncharacterized protein (TIGR03437 family)
LLKPIPVPLLCLLAFSSACLPVSAQCTTTPIGTGQTLTGTLSASCNSTRRPGSFAKSFSFWGNLNSGITIAINSTAFDAYGYLIAPTATVVASDDESGGNHNPLIRHTAATEGTYTVEVTSSSAATGNFTITLTVVTAGMPWILPNNQGVINGGSYSPTIASGSWISIRGSNLSATTRIWGSADFKGNTLPLSLDGVSVKVNNKDAPVYYISPTQINALAPPDTASGSVPVTVTNTVGTSVQVSATLQRLAPAWFAFSQGGGIYPAAVHASGAYLGPATLFGSAATAVPAMPGEEIMLFGTGFGPTTPAPDALQIISGAIPLAVPNDLTVTVGNSPAKVTFAGLTGNGLYQFNIVVPNLTDGEYSLRATIGGLQTQSLWLAVKAPTPVPKITRVTPTDWVWGQQAGMQLDGTGMAEVSKVEFSDSTGLRIVGNLSTTSTSVSFVLAVDSAATPGTRTATVVNPAGRSNAMTFTVRRGSPAITRFAPATVYTDRIYASSGLFSAPRDYFSITGTDLAGVNAIGVSPPTGLAATWSSAATSLAGIFAVGRETSLGPHQLTVSSPGGTSNALTFSVQDPPGTAPMITSATLKAPALATGSGVGTIKYSGTIQFTDSDGDIQQASSCPTRLFFVISMPPCAIVRFTPIAPGSATFDAIGTFVNQPGQTSGTIEIDYSLTVGFYSKYSGPLKVAVTLFDAAGHASNSVIVDVPTWLVPIF